jgi:hypothetical protein
MWRQDLKIIYSSCRVAFKIFTIAGSVLLWSEFLDVYTLACTTNASLISVSPLATWTEVRILVIGIHYR